MGCHLIIICGSLVFLVARFSVARGSPLALTGVGSHPTTAIFLHDLNSFNIFKDCAVRGNNCALAVLYDSIRLISQILKVSNGLIITNWRRNRQVAQSLLRL